MQLGRTQNIAFYGMMVKKLMGTEGGAVRGSQEQEASSNPEGPLACYQIAIAARLLDRTISGRLARLGATPGQLATLLALFEVDGRTQTELATATGVEQPTMAVNLRRMERDGLIERRADPGDGRKTLICLTEKARAIEGPISGLRGDIDAQALEGIGEADQCRLRDMLAIVIENLRVLAAYEKESR